MIEFSGPRRRPRAVWTSDTRQDAAALVAMATRHPVRFKFLYKIVYRSWQEWHKFRNPNSNHGPGSRTQCTCICPTFIHRWPRGKAEVDPTWTAMIEERAMEIGNEVDRQILEEIMRVNE